MPSWVAATIFAVLVVFFPFSLIFRTPAAASKAHCAVARRWPIGVIFRHRRHHGRGCRVHSQRLLSPADKSISRTD